MEEQTAAGSPFYQSESVWKNLSLGIGAIILVIFFIYLMVSSSIQATNYKDLNLPLNKQNKGVAGASVYGPPPAPPSVKSKQSIIKTTPTPTATPTPAPTVAPTSAPQPTATPVPPTAVPVTPAITSVPSPTASVSATPGQ